MKTSKKLLSLFLAVVMVVTTCSVGFTAYAQENNNSIWNTQSEAEDAFDTLDGLANDLLPSLLLGIEAVGNPIYEKKGKELFNKTLDQLTEDEKAEIAEQTSLVDILYVLQPMLLELLEGSSQQDFVEKYFPDSDVSSFDALNDDDAAISFYSLVALCDKFSQDMIGTGRYLVLDTGKIEITEANPLSDDQKQQMKDWYNALINVAQSANGVEGIVEKYAKKFGDYEGETATLSKLEGFNYGVTDEDQQLIGQSYDTYNKKLDYYHVPEGEITIDSLGSIIYYFMGNGLSLLEGYYYHYLVNLAGTDVTFVETGNPFGVTLPGASEFEYNFDFDLTPVVFAEKALEATVKGLGHDSLEDFITSMGMPATPENVAMIKDSLMGTFYKAYNEVVLPQFYRDALAGIAIENGKVKDKDDFVQRVADYMPEGWGTDACVLNADEINIMTNAFVSFSDRNTATAYSDSFFAGNPFDTSAGSKNFTVTLPDILKGTAVADYFNVVVKSDYQNITDFRNNLYKSFFPNFNMNDQYLTTDGQLPNGDKSNILVDENGVPQFDYGKYPAVIGSVNGLDADGNPETSINGYFARAEEYAYSKILTNLVGITDFSVDSETGQRIFVDVVAYIDNSVTAATSTGDVELTDAQKETIASVDFTSEIGAKMLNFTLNNTILGVFDTKLGQSTVEDLINNLLFTECDLTTALKDIWSEDRLLGSPVATLVELLPVVTVVVDELLVPFVFTGYTDGEKDQYNGLIYTFLSSGLIADYTTKAGSYIGISQIGWDLNELLPDVLHWLLEGSEYTGVDYYNLGEVQVQKNDTATNTLVPVLVNAADVDTSDPKHYKVVDGDGNELTRVDDEDGVATFTYMGKSNTDLTALLSEYPDAQFSYYMNYESDVPVITGIYIADLALRDAKISDLEGIIGKATGDQEMGKALSEAVTELATFFTAAVDEFVTNPEYRDQKKYDSLGQLVSSGLNNIFVALPQLFDIAENLFADKYGIAEDAWVYCYEGKIETDDNGNLVNNTLEEFKSFAGSSDKNRKVDIFDCFAGIFVENWLNAIISLVNNLVSTDNKISNELPIVMGLLESLGGFGEKSILTDLFNSIFQITRDSEFSFTFDSENEDPNNKLTGLSKSNAFFLITNVARLVEVVQDLIACFNTPSTTSEVADTTAVSTSTSTSTASAKASTAPYAKASTYSTQDLSNATDLINNLDKMISSLLDDTTFNDFKLDQADNIFASLVTFVSNYLGRDFSKDAKTDIVGLINTYTYYITGAETHKPDKNGDVDDKKVYTNDSLTGLVVETYALVEKIADELLQKYNCSYTLDDQSVVKYNLLVEAIDGIISPDVVSIRLEDDYEDAAKTIAKYNTWSNMTATTSRGDYKVSIDWNIKAGDKEAFFDGLAASLRVLTSIVGVLLVDTGWYDTVVTPVLNAFCQPNGIKLESIETLAADKEATGYYDETLIAIITPVSQLINTFLDKPATTLIQSVQGLAGILDDKNGASIASILKGAIDPITNEINGLANILDKGISNLSPTGAGMIRELTTKLTDLTKTDKNNALVGIQVGNGKTYPLSGANLIPIINTYLSGTGITLSNIDWNKLSTAKSPAAALVYLLEYVLDNFIDIIANLLDLGDLLDGLTAQDLLGVVNQILEASDSPTMAYWTFKQYLQERSTGFKYPAGITAAMANNGVTALDDLVAAIFPLLSSFGVDLGDDLQDVLNNNLFTNSLLTTIATALYGALDSLDPTIKAVINGLGIATSTKDVAKLLTDKSYGTTYTSAANTIKAQSSWSKVKNVNWGFKDGASNAQQGFVNALAAILRPVNNLLAVFLNEGTFHIDDAAYDIICGITVPSTTTNFTFELDGRTYMPKIVYSMKNGVFTVKLREDPSTTDYSRTSTLNIDFKSLKDLNDLKLEGTNGYNSAIIPLLEALQCSNVKTYAQYQKDVSIAKDNLLLDILNPLLGSSSSSLLSKLAKAPATTLTDLLPNIAMYLDADGLVQLVTNLLAPVTYSLNGGENPSESIGELVEVLLGAPIEDMVIPLLNGLLEDTGIKLPDIDWTFLSSLGTATSYTSKAVGSNGKYLTGKTVEADNGKVLVTVLRYVAEVLVDNASTLKKLISSIDAVGKNDMISSIVKTVFNTISTASVDQLVSAVFYLLSSNPTNAFWDYTAYETGSYSFSYPEGVDVEFLKNLPPMLDGLVGSLADLNSLIAENLYTDSIITKLVKGLYGAIEGVEINDNLNLTQLLAQTGIDFSTSNVARLLVDEDYGQTYESQASAIRAAGSWKSVSDDLKWGVKDRDSFFHALVAVLRPIYGVLDVLLNDAYLGLFDIVRIPGSNGYSSSIVPLMEAFSMYNIKTQYQYRQDMAEEYDAILLDIINPIWDKVEDILSAPLQTVAAMLPNLALFIGNDGLCQIIDNLFTPISALADSIRPIVDLNALLPTILNALDVDLNSIFAKIGVTNFSLDLYDLKETLKPLLGADSIISLVNNILGMIDINGTPLGIKLNPVDWLQLASHGTTIVSASQAATFGPRIFVEGDSSETLIAVLKYLIVTINTGDNYDAISSLIGGLIGGSGSDLSGTINEVLSMLEGDTDQVIADLVGLLQTIA